MADPRGFLTVPRRPPVPRPVPVRIRDWGEVYPEQPAAEVREQAGRCMDCGVPFCHGGCPLGNLVPEWNDLVHRDRWQLAAERLHATNNFPELTGRLCPAPCEAACVLALRDEPVTIKAVEAAVADRAWREGWADPGPPATRTGRRVAVVGSGPAGLAAAQQLTRAGHTVTVYERADRPGGLLRYGIPEFKLAKAVLDRRLDQMRAEGTRFVTSCEVGRDLTGDQLRAQSDAVVLAGGATVARDLPVPGRGLAGIELAMTYLTAANRVAAGQLAASPHSAAGRRVVILGGGDTGADCLGTAHREGAASVRQVEILPRPPASRDPSTPWPTWPLLLRTSSAHEEGGERVFATRTERFRGDRDGRVRALTVVDVTLVDGRFVENPTSRRELAADLVLLALGFTGTETGGLLDQLGVDCDPAGRIIRDDGWRTTAPDVYAAGDAGRGQSLVVWAIAEGRSVAAAVHAGLGGTPPLPAPVGPRDRPLA